MDDETMSVSLKATRDRVPCLAIRRRAEVIAHPAAARSSCPSRR
jgi:hypothetical protein